MQPTALNKVFPVPHRIGPDEQLARFLGLDTIGQVAKNAEMTRSMIDTPSLRVMLRAAEDFERAFPPGLMATLSAAVAARPAFEAALTWSPSALSAVTALQQVAVPYTDLAAINANIAAFAGLPWDQIRPAALGGLVALRPLLAQVDLDKLGLASLSLWADAQLTPAVGAALERWHGLAKVVGSEATTFAHWLPLADVALATPGLASATALGLTAHIRSRATLATLAPGWRDREDCSVISTVVSVHFRLPLDLEVPGADATLGEVMKGRLPRTLKALETLTVILNTDMPNRPKVAAFAFRDALRNFYSEVTEEEEAGQRKPDRLRGLLSTHLQQPDSGQYLAACIQLLEDVYKPVAAAAYGRGGDQASFSMWAQSALAAMAAIVSAWLEASIKEPL